MEETLSLHEIPCAYSHVSTKVDNGKRGFLHSLDSLKATPSVLQKTSAQPHDRSMQIYPMMVGHSKMNTSESKSKPMQTTCLQVQFKGLYHLTHYKF